MVNINKFKILVILVIVLNVFTACSLDNKSEKDTSKQEAKAVTMDDGKGAQNNDSDKNTNVEVVRTQEILSSDKYKGKLTVRFFNIYKKEADGRSSTGDTILISTPDGKSMLIDAGYKETVPEIIEKMKTLGITKIDYILATHMHVDHIGGFASIVNTFPIEKAIMSNIKYNSSSVTAFFKAIEEKKVEPTIVKEGDTFSLGKDVKFEVFNPEHLQDGEVGDDSYAKQNYINDTSIALKMTYGESTFFFAADIQRPTETRIVDKYGSKLDVDLVKVPHHGNDTSSGSDFIKALSPKYTVFTNCSIWSLPVYEKYQKAGSKAYVTGLDGMVLAVSDGKSINIITEKDRKGTLKP